MDADALLHQHPNDTFDHAVLLRTVRRNELLLQAVTSDELSEGRKANRLAHRPPWLDCQVPGKTQNSNAPVPCLPKQARHCGSLPETP